MMLHVIEVKIINIISIVSQPIISLGQNSLTCTRKSVHSSQSLMRCMEVDFCEINLVDLMHALVGLLLL